MVQNSCPRLDLRGSAPRLALAVGTRTPLIRRDATVSLSPLPHAHLVCPRLIPKQAGGTGRSPWTFGNAGTGSTPGQLTLPGVGWRLVTTLGRHVPRCERGGQKGAGGFSPSMSWPPQRAWPFSGSGRTHPAYGSRLSGTRMASTHAHLTRREFVLTLAAQRCLAEPSCQALRSLFRKDQDLVRGLWTSGTSSPGRPHYISGPKPFLCGLASCNSEPAGQEFQVLFRIPMTQSRPNCRTLGKQEAEGFLIFFHEEDASL